MSQARSITRLVFTYIFTVAIISILSVGVAWVWTEQQSFTERSEQIRKEYLTRTKALIKSEVDRVHERIGVIREQAWREVKSEVRSQTHLAWNIAENLWLLNRDIFETKDILTLHLQVLKMMSWIKVILCMQLLSKTTISLTSLTIKTPINLLSIQLIKIRCLKNFSPTP